jgi:hypothetical protein
MDDTAEQPIINEDTEYTVYQQGVCVDSSRPYTTYEGNHYTIDDTAYSADLDTTNMKDLLYW